MKVSTPKSFSFQTPLHKGTPRLILENTCHVTPSRLSNCSLLTKRQAGPLSQFTKRCNMETTSGISVHVTHTSTLSLLSQKRENSRRSVFLPKCQHPKGHFTGRTLSFFPLGDVTQGPDLRMNQKNSPLSFFLVDLSSSPFLVLVRPVLYYLPVLSPLSCPVLTVLGTPY